MMDTECASFLFLQTSPQPGENCQKSANNHVTFWERKTERDATTRKDKTRRKKKEGIPTEDYTSARKYVPKTHKKLETKIRVQPTYLLQEERYAAKY
jgi:hypothetical protein